MVGVVDDTPDGWTISLDGGSVAVVAFVPSLCWIGRGRRGRGLGALKRNKLRHGALLHAHPTRITSQPMGDGND